MDCEWKQHNPYLAQLWNVFDWHGPMQCIFIPALKKARKHCWLSNTLRIRSTHQLQSFYVEMRVRVRQIIPAGPIFHSQNKFIPLQSEWIRQPTQTNPSNDNKFSNLLHFVCIEFAFFVFVSSRLALLIAHLLFILQLLHILKECIKFPHTLLPAQSSARSPVNDWQKPSNDKPQNPKKMLLLVVLCCIRGSHKFNY